MKYKSNTTQSALVYCPFYISEKPNAITCEGVFSGKTTNTFKDTFAKKVHQVKYCDSKNCENCDIHILIMKRYEKR